MTPAVIAQAYKDSGVTTTKDIIAGVEQAIKRVEARIDDAYDRWPPTVAEVNTREDRKLLKAQYTFLAHLKQKPPAKKKVPAPVPKKTEKERAVERVQQHIDAIRNNKPYFR